MLPGMPTRTRHRRPAVVDEVRDAKKMVSAGQRARRIVHDLNNVLATILGSADLIHLRLKKGDPSLEEVREIQKAAERGAKLTRQLFTLLPPKAATPDAVSDTGDDG